MLDAKRNGKKHEDDYILIKKTIQEIVGKSKGKTPEKAKESKKKNQEPQGKSENLVKQFFDLQQFQKGLAAAMLNVSNKIDAKKLTKSPKNYSESLSEESEYENVSISSSSTTRRNTDKYRAQERLKMEEYNTDELSDTTSTEESELEQDYDWDGTIPEEYYSQGTSSKYDNVPKANSELSSSSSKHSEPSSDQPKKKKCLLSQSELAIIKELCRDLIKKEEKPKEDSAQVEQELPVKEPKAEESSTKEKEIEEKASNKIQEQVEIIKYKNLTENKENQKFKIVPGYKKQHEYNLMIENSVEQINNNQLEYEKNLNLSVKTEYPKQEENKIELDNTRNQNINTETENFKTKKNKNQLDDTKNHNDNITLTTEYLTYNTQAENIAVLNNPNFESVMYESTSTEETPESASEQNKLNEIKEYVEEFDEDATNAMIVKGELTLISEQKEDAVETDEKFEKVHLEIVKKETVEEVEEWKQRIEETVVIEKRVKVNKDEAKEVIEEVEKETKEVALCNISDDDLIRKTMREMDQIDQEFMMEKASPEDYNGDYYYYDETGHGDGRGEHKRNLQERLDFLQEQIHSLRSQLDEAKRQNEEEAREVGYLTQLMSGRGTSLLRSGLDWDDWELKEMIRERLEQRRQAAAADYQRRLRVVEALCSAEMGKLEEALQTLLPLNATVSAWDQPSQPSHINSSRSSCQTSDYFFEVVTSMNLSSTDENGEMWRDISTNGLQTSLAEEQKAEGQQI